MLEHILIVSAKPQECPKKTDFGRSGHHFPCGHCLSKESPYPKLLYRSWNEAVVLAKLFKNIRKDVRELRAGQFRPFSTYIESQKWSV